MTPGQTRVGWVGVGVMGASMCSHVLRAGYPVTVYTRTRSRAEPLLAGGAVWADSPWRVADHCEVVITMVGFPADVEAVYFGDSGLMSHVRSGMTLIDMTTTRPSLAVRIAEAAAARGAAAIDAPVSGGDVGARNATLSIMVGGDAGAVEDVRPLLAIMGKNIIRQGGPGAGQHAKMCNQIVIAGTMIGVCEALVYAKRAGLDLDTMLKSIRPGAAGCWTLENLAPRIVAGNFEPGFYVEHFIKDLGIALEESRRMGLSLLGLELAERLYQKAAAAGDGRKGTHALYLAIDDAEIAD